MTDPRYDLLLPSERIAAMMMIILVPSVGNHAISCQPCTIWSTSIRPLTLITVGARRLGAEDCFAQDRAADVGIVLTQTTRVSRAGAAKGSQRREVEKASEGLTEFCVV